jgi:non-ribosomal peptide synthetase component E (peptide arylation enzyme)
MILASQGIIAKWTKAGAWGNRTLIDYFHENVRKDPDKVCIVDPLNREALMGIKPERLTYREFSKAVDALPSNNSCRGLNFSRAYAVAVFGA